MSHRSSLPAESFDPLAPCDTFPERHLGPSRSDVAEMLEVIGVPSLDALIDETVPASIRRPPLRLPEPKGENELLDELRLLARRNQVHRSFIGMGYYGTITPAVIQRNILENPVWYTAYTP